jgi:hypothetical protein
MSTLKVDSILNTAGVDNRGKIVQVVSNIPQIARFSTTSTSWQATGFDIDITPKYSDSLILIATTQTMLQTTNYIHYDIKRDGTQFLVSANAADVGVGYFGYSSVWTTNSVMIPDQPNTTSPVNYEIYIKCHGSGGTGYIGIDLSAPSGSENNNAVFLQAIEVAQ